MKQTNCPYKGDMCFLYGNCEECSYYKSMQKNRRYRKTIKEINAKNAELQKQVDELKEENKELYKENTMLISGSILERKDIAKDTAKEILDELDLFFKGTTFRKGYEFKKIDEKLKELKKRNGVEVE